MKYILYVILTFIACLLFLPKSGSTEIRNVPILIAILLLLLAFILFRFFQYITLMVKTKKLFKQKGMKRTKTSIFPWCSWFHGRYQMTFQKDGCVIDVIFLVRKMKYQHYYFNDPEHVEFYRSNRVAFRSRKIEGGTISQLVETNLVGKQKLVWKPNASSEPCKNILLFDKMPYKVTDSRKREELANGDRICDSNVYLFDFQALRRATDFFME